ncbi:MlaD family protein [Sphaerisporangium fuscum]|uniref:MlaD family protein n=1 Tax=Sphaerisporangium fuscum TaxID=2835868 RepID=UPI001BDD1B22|nr:MCE family protein [Sphaerisporangium fuscum]
MKSFRERDKVTVGAVSLAVAAAVLTATFLVGGLGLLGGGYRMSAIFPDSGGLRAGDDVRVAGVTVGRVTEVRADYAHGNVVVTWRVDDGVRLGPKTRAEVTLSNLLGGRHLRLSGPVVPPYMDTLPEERRVVPTSRTGTPVLINDALKDATRVVRRIDAKAVGRLLDELAKVRTGRKGQVTHLLGNIGDLADTIGRSEPRLRELVANGDRVMRLAEAKDRELGRLVDAVQAMLDELRRRRDELRALLGDGSHLVTSLTRLIDEHEKALIGTVDDLDVISGRLRDGDRELGRTLAWAGPTFTGLSTIGGRGPWIEAITTALGPVDPEVLGLLRRHREGRR